MPHPRHVIAGATLASTLLAAAPAALACHEPPYAPGYESPVNLGVFLGFTFAPKVRFVYGAEARFGTGQAGAVVRIEGHGLSHAKLVVAGTAVTERGENEDDGARLHGEIGVALRSPHAEFGTSVGGHVAASVSEVGLNAGLRLFGTIPFNAAADAATYDYDVGMGGWLLLPGNLCMGGGRPVRDAHGVLLPAARCLSARRTTDQAWWVEAARAEASSVPAFLRLAAELRCAGAPPALIAAARDAARDEARHFHQCAAEAGGVVIAAPSPALAAPRAAASHDAALARLAVEAWQEGCLGEGIAATEVPIASIARDEARHAELGWQILAWASSHRRPVVRDAIAAELASTPVQHEVTDRALPRARRLAS